MTNSIIGFLLTPVAVIVFIVIFALSVVTLVTKHKKSSIAQKTVLGIICVVCLMYFVFILWVTIGFGSSHPAHDPIPDKGSPPTEYPDTIIVPGFDLDEPDEPDTP